MGKLVLWELGKKQSYIFKSNRLIDAIGGSLIIKDFSEDFSQEGLLEENFITKGGGKTLYFFDNSDKAKSFIKNISFKVLNEYPGLELLITSLDFDFDKDDLKDSINKIYKKLDEKKNSKKNSPYQLGFGIERRCNQTGLPSNIYDTSSKDEFISNEISIKRKYTKGKEKDNFNKLIPKGYKLEVALDSIVNPKGKSYIAVVHIDGNGMGKKIKKLQDNICKNQGESQKEFNERYKKALNSFSSDINNKYKNAFKKMCEVVEKNKDKLSQETRISEEVIFNGEKFKGIFPIRPIILAGDDITYICNGSIAIETARIMMEILEDERLNVEGIDFGNLSACAGVAIIKKGYPFKKGYELAEDLCSSAKKYLLKEGKVDKSAIDFQLLQGDLGEGLNDIREKYIGINGERLTMKPLTVGKESGFRTYNSLLESLSWLEKANKNKEIGRNKIKSMRSVFFQGRAAAENYFKFYKIPEYIGSLNHYTDEYGFDKNGTCLLLDGIEIMDFFIALDSKEAK